MTAPLLSVRDLRVHFPIRGDGLFARARPLKAVDGVSFDVVEGETLGIVGESGCGKSTLARAILGLTPATSGEVQLKGETITGLPKKVLREKRRHMQVVFQDPLASLNPRMTVGEIIGEPLAVFDRTLGTAERKKRIQSVMDRVGLLPEQINRYPHEFSGGQCQRIGIARALILDPALIVCDEPVSALDVSIQAQIVNLLMDIQRERGLSLIFIAHDLSVVRHISTRVMVMYLGKLMELADRDDIYERPQHPYTKALIDAVPLPDPGLERGRERTLLAGELPTPLDPPSGCVFRTRCPVAVGRCAEGVPEARAVDGSDVACHLANHAGAG